jgi:hypothetical protein
MAVQTAAAASAANIVALMVVSFLPLRLKANGKRSEWFPTTSLVPAHLPIVEVLHQRIEGFMEAGAARQLGPSLRHREQAGAGTRVAGRPGQLQALCRRFAERVGSIHVDVSSSTYEALTL